MGGSRREALAVSGGTEPVVGLETAGEAALVGPIERPMPVTGSSECGSRTAACSARSWPR
jgi:hypothetical protein